MSQTWPRSFICWLVVTRACRHHKQEVEDRIDDSEGGVWPKSRSGRDKNQKYFRLSDGHLSGMTLSARWVQLTVSCVCVRVWNWRYLSRNTRPTHKRGFKQPPIHRIEWRQKAYSGEFPLFFYVQHICFCSKQTQNSHLQGTCVVGQFVSV